MPSPRRLRAVLGFKRKNVPGVIAGAWGIHNGLADHPDLFPAPSPPLGTLLSLIKAAEAAQIQARTRAIGSAATRDVKVGELWTCLELLLKYVQSRADESSDLAEMLIQNAGMKVATPPVHGKGLLEIRQTQPGTVVVSAFVSLLRAQGGCKSRRVTFNWRYTADNGETWIQPPSTPVGNIEISGLPSMTRVGFSVCISDATGTRPWSDMTTALVR
jgi:hypothetical protein